MSLFTFNVFRMGENLTPPQLRRSKMTAWIRVLLRPIKWSVDLFTNDYLEGANYLNYNNSTAYVIYDRVIWEDGGVYELRVSTSTGVKPTGSNSSSVNWLKIQDNFIGLNARIKFNGQLIVFERAINLHFRVTSAPFIYVIQTLPPATQAFVEIRVPAAVYATLGPNNTARTNRIREWASQYTLGGIFIQVSTF